MAVPTSAPVNPIVSAQVTDPAPLGVVLVAVLVEENARFVIVPVIGRVALSGVVAASVPQLTGGMTDTSASVPVVTAVPLTVVLEDGCVSVIRSVPVSVRVEMHTAAPVVVVTII